MDGWPKTGPRRTERGVDPRLFNALRGQREIQVLLERLCSELLQCFILEQLGPLRLGERRCTDLCGGAAVLVGTTSGGRL